MIALCTAARGTGSSGPTWRCRHCPRDRTASSSRSCSSPRRLAVAMSFCRPSSAATSRAMKHEHGMADKFTLRLLISVLNSVERRPLETRLSSYSFICSWLFLLAFYFIDETSSTSIGFAKNIHWTFFYRSLALSLALDFFSALCLDCIVDFLSTQYALLLLLRAQLFTAYF